jgi:hypothetical protein
MQRSERLVQLSTLDSKTEAELRKQLGGQASEYLKEYNFNIHVSDLRIADC